MPDKNRCLEEIKFLARSLNRVQLLETLSQNGSLSKRELREHCSGVRTTFQRNVDALEERGWVQKRGGEYRITTSGELVVNSLSTLIATVDTVRGLEEFLKWMPTDAFDLDPLLLSDADITVAKPHNPYAAVNDHVRTLESTETYRALLPVVGRDSLETRWRRLQISDGWDEFVVESKAADVLKSDPNFGDTFQEMRETGRVTAFVIDESLPFFLGIYEDVVHIGVEDEDGMPRALVETASEDVREWAENRFEDYKRRAVKLE